MWNPLKRKPKEPSCLDCKQFQWRGNLAFCLIDGDAISKPHEGICAHDFEPKDQPNG